MECQWAADTEVDLEVRRWEAHHWEAASAAAWEWEAADSTAAWEAVLAAVMAAAAADTAKVQEPQKRGNGQSDRNFACEVTLPLA